MTDLEVTRDHLRRLAHSAHRSDCTGPDRWPNGHRRLNLFGEEVPVHPDPQCPGCLTDGQRADAARLADEIDEHLTRDDQDGDGLW